MSLRKLASELKILYAVRVTDPLIHIVGNSC